MSSDDPTKKEKERRQLTVAAALCDPRIWQKGTGFTVAWGAPLLFSGIIVLTACNVGASVFPHSSGASSLSAGTAPRSHAFIIVAMAIFALCIIGAIDASLRACSKEKKEEERNQRTEQQKKNTILIVGEMASWLTCVAGGLMSRFPALHLYPAGGPAVIAFGVLGLAYFIFQQRDKKESSWNTLGLKI